MFMGDIYVSKRDLSNIIQIMGVATPLLAGVKNYTPKTFTSMLVYKIEPDDIGEYERSREIYRATEEEIRTFYQIAVPDDQLDEFESLDQIVKYIRSEKFSRVR